MLTGGWANTLCERIKRHKVPFRLTGWYQRVLQGIQTEKHPFEMFPRMKPTELPFYKNQRQLQGVNFNL
jgi:hypothetical protein